MTESPRKAKAVIAIDGPAGCGKSTVAQMLARRLGYTYIDTGAMYRAVAYHVQQAGLDVETDAEEIVRLARELSFEFQQVGDSQHLFVDGEDVEEVIRSVEVGNLSSPVSAIPQVREHLVAAQRQMAAAGGVVMEGRDIGTVVLPDADLKVFLTATAGERARRRWRQLQEQGIIDDYEQVLRDQLERDKRDSSRTVAPLRPAEDARELVTDEVTAQQVVDILEGWLQEALCRGGNHAQGA